AGLRRGGCPCRRRRGRERGLRNGRRLASHMAFPFTQASSLRQKGTTIAAGAQTERPGLAGPVRGLLGGRTSPALFAMRLSAFPPPRVSRREKKNLFGARCFVREWRRPGRRGHCLATYPYQGLVSEGSWLRDRGPCLAGSVRGRPSTACFSLPVRPGIS